VDVIDPDILRFTTQVMADYRRLTSGRAQPPVEMRRVAEEVRAPWRTGGPVMRDTREVVVSTTHGPVRLRIHDPGALEPKPALVYLHGGGWMLFSLDTHDRVMREYAARAGVVVIGVDYALSPEVRFPVALEQVIDVVRWLAAHGAEFGIDPRRLALGGDSAGGNLSLGTALTLRDAGESEHVKGLLLIYPAVDDRCSADAVRRHGGPGAILTGEEIAWFWDHYTGGVDVHDNPLACPIRASLAGLPPVCMTVGACDVLTEQCLEMVDRLRAAGVPVTSTVYPGATHSFIEAVSSAPLAQRAIADGAAWLRTALR
jgi:acetyl esterase/lipase